MASPCRRPPQEDGAGLALADGVVSQNHSLRSCQSQEMGRIRPSSSSARRGSLGEGCRRSHELKEQHERDEQHVPQEQHEQHAQQVLKSSESPASFGRTARKACSRRLLAGRRKFWKAGSR